MRFLEQVCSVKGQGGTNFDIADLLVSVIATQLCRWAQAAVANVQANRFDGVPIKLY